eukprot:14796629-Alexandrium_andersonii.AAC.1
MAKAQAKKAKRLAASPKRAWQSIIHDGIELQVVWRGGGGGVAVAADPVALKAVVEGVRAAYTGGVEKKKRRRAAAV